MKNSFVRTILWLLLTVGLASELEGRHLVPNSSTSTFSSRRLIFDEVNGTSNLRSAQRATDSKSSPERTKSVHSNASSSRKSQKSSKNGESKTVQASSKMNKSSKTIASGSKTSKVGSRQSTSLGMNKGSKGSAMKKSKAASKQMSKIDSNRGSRPKAATIPPPTVTTQVPSSTPTASPITSVPDNTFRPTEQPQKQTGSPNFSTSPSASLTTSPTPSISVVPTLPSTYISPSLVPNNTSLVPSLNPLPPGSTTPTILGPSGSAAPSIPVIETIVPQFYISYVSPDATDSPTRVEFELLLNATVIYFENFLFDYYADVTGVHFERVSGTLNNTGFELGIPEPPANLYMDFQIFTFFAANSTSLPTPQELFEILTGTITTDYILECVRTVDVSQFDGVTEVYFGKLDASSTVPSGKVMVFDQKTEHVNSRVKIPEDTFHIRVRMPDSMFRSP